MRITPVGIAIDIAQPERFINTVVQACQVTHNTSLGIASAAAVAAVVSSGINGKKREHALNAGTEMAFIAEHHGHWVAGGRARARVSAGPDRQAASATPTTLATCCMT